MGLEYINRISYKKDGVYVSTKSSNDDMPYHVIKLDDVSETYLTEGKEKADLELAKMFMDYCEPRGSHKSVQKFRALYNSQKLTDSEIQYQDDRSEIFQDFKKNNPGYDIRNGIFGRWKEQLNALNAERDKTIGTFLSQYGKQYQIEKG